MGVGRAVDRLTVQAVLERFDSATVEFAGLPLDALSHTDLLAVADRVEAAKRRLAMVDHRIVGRLAAECSPPLPGSPMPACWPRVRR